MKIAIMAFEVSLTSKNLRGISTTSRYLRQDLCDVGLETDLIVYGKGKMNYPESFGTVKHYKTLEELKGLKNEYVFIIYYTPGISLEKFNEKTPEKYTEVLDAIGLPFTFIYHSECYVEHNPYRMNFLNHRDCKFLTFISDDFKDIYEEDLTLVPDYVDVKMLPPLNSLEYILSKNKSNSVICTSAWTTFKKNYEYLGLVDKFLEMGITPYCAGSPNSNFYMNTILDNLVDHIELITEDTEPDEKSKSRYQDYRCMFSRLKQSIEDVENEKCLNSKVVGANIYNKSGNFWRDYGSYFPEQLKEILSDKKFHWNVSYYKVNKPYTPKFEIVTLEAFNEGCLPVICKNNTPDYVPDDSAVRIDQHNYIEDAKMLMNMSEEERINRLTKFYHVLKDNLYGDIFNNMKRKIEECVNAK